MSRVSTVILLLVPFLALSIADSFLIGKKFELKWNGNELVLSHIESNVPSAHKQIPLWKTYKEYPFLLIGNASLPRPPISDGNYQLSEKIEYLSDRTTVDDVTPSENSNGCLITGRLLKAQIPVQQIASYQLKFSESESGQLEFTVDIIPNSDIFDTPPGSSLKNPRTFLTYACDADENFYGFGESFSFFNLKGRNVPILVSEQGVGRGEQPITDTLNSDVAQGVGGAWYTTYAPKPIYITNHNRTVMLSNSEVSFFNLTHTTAEGTYADYHCK